MCQLLQDSVLEYGGRGSKKYLLTWKCCNCDEGFWSVKLHGVCLSCGHYRCADVVHRNVSPSAENSHRPTTGYEASASWGNGRYQESFQPPFQQIQAMTTRVVAQDPAVFTSSPSVVPPELPSQAPELSQASHSPKTEIDTTSENLSRGDDRPGQEENIQSEAENRHGGISLDPALPSSSFLACIRSTKRPAFTSNAPSRPACIKSYFAPALGNWRDEGGTPEADSSDYSVDTPAESEDESSTRSREGEDPMSSPDIISGNMDRLNIDPGESGSSTSDATDSSSSFVVIGGARGDGLLEQAWFHRNVRRILQTFMRKWQNGRVRAEGNSAGESSSSEQLPPSNQQQERDGQRKRKERADSDDAPGRSRSLTTSKRTKGSQESDGPECPRPFACPFCKKDLQRYQSCARFGFKKVRHVKQHVLHRSHSHEINEPTKDRLRQRSARGLSKEEQWYEIFDTLFPGHLPRPASPYNDFKLSEQPAPASQPVSGGIPLDEALYIPAEYLTGPGAEVLQRAVIEDPAFSRLSEDTVRSALNRGLSLVLESFLEHRLEQLLPAQVSTAHTVEEDSPAVIQAFPEQEPRSSDAYFNDSDGVLDRPSWTAIASPPTSSLPAHGQITGGDDFPREEFFAERIVDGSPHDPFFYGEQGPRLQGQELDIPAESTELLQGSQHDLEVEWLLDLHSGDDWHLDGEWPVEQSSGTLPLQEPRY